jgi:hypothetical protein
MLRRRGIVRGRRRGRTLGVFVFLAVLMFGLESLTPRPLRRRMLWFFISLVAAGSLRRLRVRVVLVVIARLRVPIAHFLVVRLRVLRMSTRLVGVLPLSMRFPLSGCGVVRVMVRLMMRCIRFERLVLFLLVTVRIRCVPRRVGVITVMRMPMRTRMMRALFRCGVLFAVVVMRVRVRVEA